MFFDRSGTRKVLLALAVIGVCLVGCGGSSGGGSAPKDSFPEAPYKANLQMSPGSAGTYTFGVDTGKKGEGSGGTYCSPALRIDTFLHPEKYTVGAHGFYSEARSAQDLVSEPIVGEWSELVNGYGTWGNPEARSYIRFTPIADGRNIANLQLWTHEGLKKLDMELSCDIRDGTAYLKCVDRIAGDTLTANDIDAFANLVRPRMVATGFFKPGEIELYPTCLPMIALMSDGATELDKIRGVHDEE